jgi:membrane dipeptidase
VSPAAPEDRRSAAELPPRFPVLDGHNDLPWALREAGLPGPPWAADIAAPVAFTHTDLPRLAAGGVGGQFWSVYVPASLAGDAAVATTIEQIDLVRQLVARYPGTLELSLTAAAAQAALAAG